MRFLRQAFPFIVMGITHFLVFSCANIQAPSGGLRDKKGPVPRDELTNPPDKTLNFDGDQIVFHFDEFIKPGGYAGEVFVSPVQEIPPSVMVIGKRLIIKLKDSLLANTTYVITISTGIKDATEGNEMSSPIVYAFSTGNELDSLNIKGSVKDPITGKGLKDYTLLLYPEDRIVGDSIFDKKPVYAAITDESGNYGLFYLARKKYKIYGVSDIDKSFSYNQSSEMIALAENPLVVFPDSLNVTRKDLVAFQQDQDPPIPRAAKWANSQTLVIDFKEKIREVFKGDSLKIFISDTLGKEKQQITGYSFAEKKPSKLFVPAEQVEDKVYLLTFENLMDSLGNKTDTTIRAFSSGRDKFFYNTTFFEPKIEMESSKVLLQCALRIIPGQHDTMISIRDTSGKYVAVELKISGYDLELKLDSFPELNNQYNLVLAAGLQFGQDSILDTTTRFPLLFPKSEGFGTAFGSVQDSAYPGDWIIYLRNDKGKVVRKSFEEKFVFKSLKAGNYSFFLIDDKDQNQCWTPGSLMPYTLPEKVWKDPTPLDVRANWDIEEYIISPVESKAVEPDSAKVEDSAAGAGRGRRGRGK